MFGEASVGFRLTNVGLAGRTLPTAWTEAVTLSESAVPLLLATTLDRSVAPEVACCSAAEVEPWATMEVALTLVRRVAVEDPLLLVTA